MSPKHWFTTKDLVTIALLSAVGGVMSTYIGYLGNMVNHIFGVPFGAGQFMAGLHVIWIMLALGVTKKKGAATTVGILKGFVELFMGSTHGIVIVAVSAVQGLVPDLILFSDKAKGERNLVTYSIAGGLSAATNVVVFQIFFFSGIPVILIAMLCMLAAASGAIFGGWLVLDMLDSLEYAGIVRAKKAVMVDSPEQMKEAWGELQAKRRKARLSVAVMAVFLALFTIGGVYYYAVVYAVPGDSIAVDGAVEEPFDFVYSDFEDQEVTVNAELIGSVTHEPPKNYTGIPLHVILEHAGPLPAATEVVVTGSDGYYATFPLAGLLTDDTAIMIYEEDAYRVIAAEYAGGYWVEDVVSIEVR